ncbi:histidine kinase [Klebsiella sp. R390]|uniref:histidine kinase n=1 Tax=Klebsiella sp. R390 TaxID=2755400 RepID=UPI003DA91BE4
MEWWVKKMRSANETGQYCVVLQSGQLAIIATIDSCHSLLQCGDKLTPLANARYCVNGDLANTIKVTKARPYSTEYWAEAVTPA